jgi:hypothetical protein
VLLLLLLPLLPLWAVGSLCPVCNFVEGETCSFVL